MADLDRLIAGDEGTGVGRIPTALGDVWPLPGPDWSEFNGEAEGFIFESF